MGEISFSYNIKTEPVYEAMFKYWFSKSIEYSFVYQRYIAFSDASIFNGPVAITKVAAGLYQLYDLFIDKKTHSAVYEKLIKNFNENKHENTNTYEQLENVSNCYPFNTDEYKESFSFKKETIQIDKYNNCNLVSKKTNNSCINLKEYWLSNLYLLNIYDNSILKKLYENELTIYSTLYITNREKYFGKELNIYNTLLGKMNRISMNIINTIPLSPYRIGMNILSTYFGWQDKFKLNRILQTSLSYAHILSNNIIEQVFSERLNSPISIIENIISGNRSKRNTAFPNNVITKKTENINVYAENALSIDRNIRYVQLSDIVFANKSFRYINKQNFVNGYVYNKTGNKFKNTFVQNKNKPTSVSNNMKHVICNNDKSFYEQQYSVQLYQKPLYNSNTNIFTKLKYKYCFVIQNTFTTLNPKKFGIEAIKYQCIKLSKELFIENSTRVKINEKKLMTLTNVYIAKQYKELCVSYNEIFVNKNKNISFQSIKELNMNKIIFADKVNKYFEMYYVDIFVDERQKSITKFDNAIYINKNKKNINTKQYTDAINASRLSNFAYSFDNSWFSREIYNTTLFEQEFVDKKLYYASIYRQTQAFINKKTIVLIENFDSVIKNNIPVDNNILFSGFAGIIIPLSKIKHQAYVDNINLMAQKLFKDSCITQSLSASTISKNSYVSGIDLFCDKKEFDVYLNYKNIQITKAKIHSLIHKDVFLKKRQQYLYLKNQLWVNKNLTKTQYYNKESQVKKQSVDVYIGDVLTGNINPKNIYCHNSLFVDKLTEMCYYSYNVMLTDKSLNAQIHNQLTRLTQEQRKTRMFDCVSPLIKEQLEAFYDYGIFANKFIYESDLFKQIHDVHKIAQDTGIKPEDFGNWAWVYEEPDPFIGLDFGIDELLLPENDTRYENFEDIVFDKQNMRPKNPVKQINENTFIAKYPIRHPIPKYGDIAINYDKSAIKVDQFYGIETSIMHTVFLKFYRIWQSKIFEFGTMTMVQSVKTILEYLYTWIMEYFPVEEIEQALRVFKLIRWYGESSIIQNSQYIISYEYDTLESKLNTGTCLIPNNLDINDTMYVDAKLGVIRNNPTYINQGTGAYVTFEIDNKKNSTFTFSLSNTVGSVYIYINDVLVDTVSKSALNLTYELPYTGDVNIVKIEKIASHNLNGNFYIGNIKVPNCTFKNLSIEFDPTLKAGNKPLNEIARKMITYANLYENKEEAYEIIRKGNLGVGEIYKRLTEYWELHHQNKTKGKRLTIKEI